MVGHFIYLVFKSKRSGTISLHFKIIGLPHCANIFQVLPNRTVKSRSIIVRWNDAPIGKFLTNYNGRLAFEYTIDISPAPANEFGLKSVLFKKDSVNSAPNSNDIESKSDGCEKNFRYEVCSNKKVIVCTQFSLF